VSDREEQRFIAAMTAQAIQAARIEGARLALEAAAGIVPRVHVVCGGMIRSIVDIQSAIRAIDPAHILRGTGK
jgi:hypothetical protein